MTKPEIQALMDGEQIIYDSDEVIDDIARTAIGALNERDAARERSRVQSEVADGRLCEQEAIKTAVISALSGVTDYEGLPITKLNYLQGIRKTVERLAESEEAHGVTKIMLRASGTVVTKKDKRIAELEETITKLREINSECAEVLRYLKAAKLSVPEWIVEKLGYALADTEET